MSQIHFFLVCLFGQTLASWQDGARINSHLSKEALQHSILGSFSNEAEDRLSLLMTTSEYILVGARDAIFNLSSTDLKLNSILNWTVSPDHQEMCQVKGQRDSDCHNYIRVFHGPIHHHHAHHAEQRSLPRLPGEEEMEEKWIICGTNAFKPLCRLYNSDFKGYTHEFSGVGYSPFDPGQRSTSVLHHGSVYSGTVADFGGSDSLIYKSPLRTEQHDLRHLNNPTFVSSLSHGDLALFFYRELAIEHTNCGKAVYSRVARICQHDSGSKKHKDRFTTFLKARLNCSVPGEFPFYFDHIHGTTTITDEQILYAVFTTGDNSLGASALCAFKVSDILTVFDGPFKGQATDDSNWLPVPSSHVPIPRPGTCSPELTKTLPDAASSAFHKGHPLMDLAVHGSSTLVHTSNDDRFRIVEVAPSATSDTNRHLLYIGTSTGKVLKVAVTYSDPKFDPGTLSLNSSLISASWQVSDRPIKSLKLVDPTRLLVGTESDLVLITTQHCALYATCTECIELRDPHCFWEMHHGACVTAEKLKDFVLRQDLENGDAGFCPLALLPNASVHTKPTEAPVSPTKEDCCTCPTPPTPTTLPPIDMNDDIDNQVPEVEGGFRYSGGDPAHYEDEKPMTLDPYSNVVDKIPIQSYDPLSVVHSREEFLSRGSIAMATVVAAFIALLLGFTIGFAGSRWFGKNKIVASTGATNAQLAASIHEQSQRLTSKPMDFTLDMNPWNGTIKNNPSKLNLNIDTLEKTVKKIYI